LPFAVCAALAYPGTHAIIVYLETYIHPQAVIVDGTETEETTFLEALHVYFEKSEQSIIELPHNGAQRLGWLAKLDSASLSGTSNHVNKLPVLANGIPRSLEQGELRNRHSRAYEGVRELNPSLEILV
jgi:hypothetical protein